MEHRRRTVVAVRRPRLLGRLHREPEGAGMEPCHAGGYATGRHRAHAARAHPRYHRHQLLSTSPRYPGDVRGGRICQCVGSAEAAPAGVDICGLGCGRDTGEMESTGGAYTGIIA